MYQPLADKIRPTELDDMVGQQHIIGPDGILRRIVESGNIPNMIFYGPSGIGKTTLAEIIAGKTSRRLYKLNATTAGVGDIKDMVSQLDTLLAPNGILLYLDEIQYFNKKQQQSLLEFIESGKITLIASTTENPYFYVYNAILSRITIFEFMPITPEDIQKAVRRAFTLCAREMKKKIVLEEGVTEYIAMSCGGDVRKSINAVELLCYANGTNVNDRIDIPTLRQTVGLPQVAARFQRRRRPALSCPAACRGRHGFCHKAYAVCRQRGCRAGLSPGHNDRQGLL